jgi:hypothetical protein
MTSAFAEPAQRLNPSPAVITFGQGIAGALLGDMLSVYA